MLGFKLQMNFYFTLTMRTEPLTGGDSSSSEMRGSNDNSNILFSGPNRKSHRNISISKLFWTQKVKFTSIPS